MLTSFMTACCDIEFYGRELFWQVLWPRVMIWSSVAASYVVEFNDRVLWYWVPWPRAMTACCDVLWYWVFFTARYVDEFYKRVLRCVVILSFMAASYVEEFYHCVPGCRVSWSRAMCCDIEFHGRELRWRVLWPRARNDESAGHVLKWFDLKIKKSY